MQSALHALDGIIILSDRVAWQAFGVEAVRLYPSPFVMSIAHDGTGLTLKRHAMRLASRPAITGSMLPLCSAPSTDGENARKIGLR